MVLRADNGLLNIPKCLEMLDDAASMGGIKKQELIKTFLEQPEGRAFAMEIAWKHVKYYLEIAWNNSVLRLRTALTRWRTKRNGKNMARSSSML